MRIEDYAIIGDLHTAALVSTAGSIDWLCLPRFDEPACFAALVHDEDAGHWTLAPAGSSRCTTRYYSGDSAVLVTEWSSTEGSVRVTDLMSRSAATPHVIRIVEGLSGAVAMRSTLRIRTDYGRVIPWVRAEPRGVRAVAGPDQFVLTTPAPVVGQDFATVSEFMVRPGDRVPFVLSWAPGHVAQPEPVDPESALQEELASWRAWTGRATGIDGPYRDAMLRSLITLKTLTYEPTGGIVAAATTSLPEQLGGERNWDYRYCWLRDATYTLQALLAAGYVDEASAWRQWLLRSIAGQPNALQIMYSLDGRQRLPEQTLDWLDGYEGSRPVRVGNAASEQLQLDVWGETLDGLYLARVAGMASDRDAWDLQVALMDHLESSWDQPDNGLWEVRGRQRHFVHSKVMAWVAADRMARSVVEYGLPGRREAWQDLATRIKRDVLEHGFDEGRNSFVQSYGSTALDASVLLMPRVGFLPATDPRMLATIDAIQRDLTDDGFVLRYEPSASDDGLSGGEGVFVACSFWLVDALHAAGRDSEATALFERLLDVRNDVGLLSEEWDPKARRQLGNTPQAFSHFGLVVSASQLHAGRPCRSDEMPPPATKSARA